MNENFSDSLGRLSSIISILRAPGGCPWDQKATLDSLKGNLLEECFEVLDAVDSKDNSHIEEELGDVAINLMMMIFAAEGQGLLKAEDCINSACEKLIRRHPHVFSSDGRPLTDEEKSKSGLDKITGKNVNENWDKIKDSVEGRKKDHLLDSIPKSFPPLLKAGKILSKSGKVGWKWQNLDAAASKVSEELSECRAAENSADKKHLEEECGDLLFAAASYAYTAGVNPELALNRANSKVCRRFAYVEDEMKKAAIPMDFDHSGDEARFWDEAKKKGL